MKRLDAKDGLRRTSAEEKTVGIVARAASMLECFTRERPSLSLSELSSHLSLPKPSTFRIATVLLRVGLLEQMPNTGAYTLGFVSLRYAEGLLAGVRIRRLARPIMEGLRDELNETIVLSLRDGDFRYNIDSVESTHAIGQTQRVGSPIPLYAGAASRVMLGGMPSVELDDYLRRVKLLAYSPVTITDVTQLRIAVERARKNGFVSTSGEFTSGSHAVARLINAPASYGVAALHVSIPHSRYSKGLERTAVGALQAAVHNISDAASQEA
jgi:DNA-binding IclR family transcriptional regulator